MFRTVPAFLLALLLVPSSGDSAQGADASETLRIGIVSFYRGDYEQAAGQLTDAIELQPRDPRAFYFRGLARLRLGLKEAAEEDFSQGATLEARYGRQDVGLALQRVQGPERLVIEQHRRQARKRIQRARLARRGTSAAEPAEQRPATPPVDLPPTEIPATFEQLADDPTDPFGATSAELLGQGPAEPAAGAGTPADLPVDEPPAPETDEGTFVGDDAEDDLFSQPEVGTGIPDESAASRPAPSGGSEVSGQGVLGSVFRALSRSVVPQPVRQANQAADRLRGLLPGAGPAPPPGEGVNLGPGGVPSDQDPFNDGTPRDGTPQEDDPFADDTLMEEDNPFGQESDVPAIENDPFGNGDVLEQDDPFAEEDDPFSDDGAATDTLLDEDPFAE